MGKNTKISWADHTWSPWRGCAKVSPGCDNCYAAQGARRFPGRMGVWGRVEDGGTRVLAVPQYMREIHTWNAQAAPSLAGLGRRPRVFVGSVMDFYEDTAEVAGRRGETFDIMAACKNLTFMLLTKRPENIGRLSPWGYLVGDEAASDYVKSVYPHVWVGTTIENRDVMEDRLPDLIRNLPDGMTRWLSCEPLLESIDLTPWLATGKIHWVVVGGESLQGGRCRDFNVEWAEEVVTQCDAFKVPVFVKQLGSKPLVPNSGGGTIPLRLKARAGTVPAEWPDWLRRQEFPDDGTR